MELSVELSWPSRPDCVEGAETFLQLWQFQRTQWHPSIWNRRILEPQRLPRSDHLPSWDLIKNTKVTLMEFQKSYVGRYKSLQYTTSQAFIIEWPDRSHSPSWHHGSLGVCLKSTKRILQFDEPKIELFILNAKSYIRRKPDIVHHLTNSMPKVKHGDGSIKLWAWISAGETGKLVKIGRKEECSWL